MELPEGEYPVTILNPIYDNEYNFTITTDNNWGVDVNQTVDDTETKTANQTVNTTGTDGYTKKAITYNSHKSPKKKQTHSIREYNNNGLHAKYFTLNRLNAIFGHNFINGHLIIYIDGKIVFNATVNDDPTSILFEIIGIYLGQHELKVECTVGDNTQTFTKNVTI